MENQGSKWGSSINLVAGLWLIISPFIIGYALAATMWNLVIVGILVALFALIRLSNNGSESTNWASWLNSILGLWLILSPFVLNFSRTSEVYNSLILGIIIAIAGYRSANLSSPHRVLPA